MKLSVIIPVYNMERYLTDCLESILHSAGDDSALELLLIDDGSKDSSGTICDRYAASDPRIRVIHQPNGGVSSARNTGLELATGTYIAWVDPDDLVDPAWFPRIRQTILDHNPDVIVMDSLRFGVYEQPECYNRMPGWIPPEQFLSDAVADVRLLGGMPNKVIRSAFWDGLRFDPSLIILEDYALIWSLLKGVQSVYYVDCVLYHYRQHTESLLHHTSADRAYAGVLLARRRCEEVSPQYRSDARIALDIQMYMFCRQCILNGQSDNRYRDGIRELRRRLTAFLLHKQPTRSWKLKFLLMGTGLMKPILQMKHHL